MSVIWPACSSPVRTSKQQQKEQPNWRPSPLLPQREIQYKMDEIWEDSQALKIGDDGTSHYHLVDHIIIGSVDSLLNPDMMVLRNGNRRNR